MYISKFSAFNYRSLKQVSIRFEAGKNVIVGKNNSGKSNIIKGLELLVGEKFPIYHKFTDNDFYTYEQVDEDAVVTEVIAENIYLDAEIEGRDFDEGLINSIKKKTAFSKLTSPTAVYGIEDGNININFDFFQSLENIDERSEIAVLGYRGEFEIKSEWKNPEQLLDFLKSATLLKLFFCKSRIDDEKSGFGILCKVNGSYWVSNFLSKKLRDSLITTAVIGAQRSQKEDLRMVHYTWFGKLISGLWDISKKKIEAISNETYEDLIKASSDTIKRYVDEVFHTETLEIRKLLEGAIAHKSVSFKFMSDVKNELYKNVQMFVHDGIDRPLHDKGTGIQSAIIISLFTLYCNKYHKSSSLLIAEEPELYLHPQARRVISAELEKFIKGSQSQSRQLIISTHSTEYLRNVEPYNIVRVYKDTEFNCSLAKQLDRETSESITVEIKRFLWSSNTEIFFADKVVLVEGGEVYLISALVDKFKKLKQHLDYRNVTVARVNGKGSFLTYVKMLEKYGIKYLVLGDLDCFKDEVSKLITHLKIDSINREVQNIKKAISDMSIDYGAITKRTKDVNQNIDAQTLQGLFEKFENGEIERDDAELLGTIRYMQSRYTKGDKVKAIIDAITEKTFQKVLMDLQEQNIFIWSKGELEDYYTKKSKGLRGTKDIKALELSHLIPASPDINELFQHTDEIERLIDIILIDNESIHKTFDENAVKEQKKPEIATQNEMFLAELTLTNGLEASSPITNTEP